MNYIRKHKITFDYETRSSVNLKTAGLYKYMESPDFMILLMSYIIDEQPVKQIDFLHGEYLPNDVRDMLLDPCVIKEAHNAPFEHRATEILLNTTIDPYAWECSLVKCAYCGLPLKLGEATAALNLNIQKLKSGNDLIKTFSTPRTKKRTDKEFIPWNLPEHSPELAQKWLNYKYYNVVDTQSEKALSDRLAMFPLPEKEKRLYYIDRCINMRGVKIDTRFAANAVEVDKDFKEIQKEKLTNLTNLDNVNSDMQLLSWLNDRGAKLQDLQKEKISDYLRRKDVPVQVRAALELRKQIKKTSNAKYAAMVAGTQNDGRIRNAFQFYGASRTGRWAGRLVQLHNLPRMFFDDDNKQDIELLTARNLVNIGDAPFFNSFYGDDSSNILSQLIRTALIAENGKTFVVADFSAIEARVIAWYAREQWRLDVFNTHGKIYEASASQMFGIPIEECGKGSPYRAKGKVAELALGFGGWIDAFLRMAGKDADNFTVDEVKQIILAWRDKSPRIVQFWRMLEDAALSAVGTPNVKFIVESDGYWKLEFLVVDDWLTIKLPSGRYLMYYKPELTYGDRGIGVTYLGKDNNAKVMIRQKTYGGKLCENVVQATARDLLGEKMILLEPEPAFDIVAHVHDELVFETDDIAPKEKLRYICDVMAKPVDWARDLPLKAEGFYSYFYKKD